VKKQHKCPFTLSHLYSHFRSEDIKRSYNPVKTDIQLPAPEASSEAEHPSPEGACWALFLLSYKRRILQANFIDTLARKLKPSGQLHLATDWDDYAEHMRDEMAASEHFELTSNERGERPMTKFEQRGLRLGHRVQDLLYTRR